MRIINVVKINDNILDEITSFGVFEEQLSDDVVADAEAKFIEVAKEIGFTENNFDQITEADLLDDGYYKLDDMSVCIAWSDI